MPPFYRAGLGPAHPLARIIARMAARIGAGSFGQVARTLSKSGESASDSASPDLDFLRFTLEKRALSNPVRDTGGTYFVGAVLGSAGSDA